MQPNCLRNTWLSIIIQYKIHGICCVNEIYMKLCVLWYIYGAEHTPIQRHVYIIESLECACVFAGVCHA